MRASSRRVCSSGPTSSQYLIRMIPESTIARSTTGTIRRKRSTSSFVQKPITRSTPARLYQLRSKMTTSPARREVRQVALDVHLALLALGRRRQRDDAEDAGLTRSVIALDDAALAGAIATLEHDADLEPPRDDPLLEPTSSACRRASSFSYSLRFILETTRPLSSVPFGFLLLMSNLCPALHPLRSSASHGCRPTIPRAAPPTVRRRGAAGEAHPQRAGADGEAQRRLEREHLPVNGRGHGLVLVRRSGVGVHVVGLGPDGFGSQN